MKYKVVYVEFNADFTVDVPDGYIPLKTTRTKPLSGSYDGIVTHPIGYLLCLAPTQLVCELEVDTEK